MREHEPIQTYRPWEAREADQRPLVEVQTQAGRRNHVEGSRSELPPDVAAQREARVREAERRVAQHYREEREARLRRVAEMVACACGCGVMIHRYDWLGRQRLCVSGHKGRA